MGASETVGKVISKGDIVVYESTVYPGVTEEKCLPVVERVSGLKFNVDFYAGYSPERINPGDKENTVEKIKKVTSGSTPEIADIVDNLYKEIILMNIYITLDYELFLGPKTGSVDKCLIEPTYNLCKVVSKHGSKMVFFIDV